jgi:glucan phosphorylase
MNEKARRNLALSAQPVSDRNIRTIEAFKQALADNLCYTRGQAAPTASPQDVYAALAYTVRDYLVDRWQRTVATYTQRRPKFVSYLSAEYLPGRQITQNLLYTGTFDLARQALAELDAQVHSQHGALRLLLLRSGRAPILRGHLRDRAAGHKGITSNE